MHEEINVSLRFYVVGLLDLVGQRKHLAELDHICNQNAGEVAMHQGMSRTYEQVLRFRHKFRELANSSKNKERREYPVPLTEEQKVITDRVLRSPIETIAFSDTVVVFSPLEVHNEVVLLTPVWGVVAAAANLFMIYLEQKNPFRGAIEVGWGMSADRDFYGPVLASAHQMESEVAKFPRIIVGPHLMLVLHQQAELKGEDLPSMHSAEMSRMMLGMITKWDDDQWMIDMVKFVDFMTRSRAISADQGLLAKKTMLKSASEELALHEKQGDKKLVAYYNHLTAALQGGRPEVDLKTFERFPAVP